MALVLVEDRAKAGIRRRSSHEEWRRYVDVLGGRFGRQALAAPGPLDAEDARLTLEEAARNLAAALARAAPPLDGAAD